MANANVVVGGEPGSGAGTTEPKKEDVGGGPSLIDSQKKTGPEKRIDHEGDSLLYRALPVQRLPFTIATQEQINSKGADHLLNFWVNPSECQWRVGTRTFIEPIAGGAIHHEWPSVPLGIQSAGKFDQPVVNLSFQSGLIKPYGYQNIASEDAVKNIPPGLANFYDFLDILAAPNLLADGNPNYVNIFYNSLMFPHMWLQGFFTPDGVQWTETAENPNMIQNWGASFIVFQSTPALTTSRLRDVFRRQGFRVPDSYSRANPPPRSFGDLAQDSLNHINQFINNLSGGGSGNVPGATVNGKGFSLGDFFSDDAPPAAPAAPAGPPSAG